MEEILKRIEVMRLRNIETDVEGPPVEIDDDIPRLTKALRLAVKTIDKLPHEMICGIMGGYGYCSCLKRDALAEIEKVLK